MPDAPLSDAGIFSRILNDDLLATLTLVRQQRPPTDSVRQHLELLAQHTQSPEAYAAHYSTMWSGSTRDEVIPIAHQILPRFAPIRQYIAEALPTLMLDLGCLDGWALYNAEEFIQGGVGVDLNLPALQIASGRATIRQKPYWFVNNFIENFRIEYYPSIQQHAVFPTSERPDVFDVVLLNEVLEHMLDPMLGIATAVHHLAPGGVVCLSTPATPIPHNGKILDALLHLRVLRREEILQWIPSGYTLELEFLTHEEDAVSKQPFSNRGMIFRRPT
jgi:SAM-dependent methyltransferase